MIERIILPLVIVFLCSQTRISWDTQASPVPADAVKPVFHQRGDHVQVSRSVDSKGPRDKRQIDLEETDVDVDGPYGYIPRVVHGVRKIVKGLLNGSVHSIFHGAFGIAPEDVSDDLIGTYNQIFGIPDPDDLPDRVRKPKPKPTKAAATVSSGNSTSEASVGIKEKNSKDEEEDDEDLDEDDDK